MMILIIIMMASKMVSIMEFIIIIIIISLTEDIIMGMAIKYLVVDTIIIEASFKY